VPETAGGREPLGAGQRFVADLAAARVLAIIRGRETAAVIETAVALLDEGIAFVEVALTTPGACDANVVAAGAQFIVTPAVAPSIEAAADRGLPVAAGALTPTEAWTAVQRGASAVKLFPASLGGPALLKAVRDPFPDIPFLAVGGVGLADVEPYLEVGAIGVGVGGPLVGDAASGGDLEALRERARAYLAVAERFPA